MKANSVIWVTLSAVLLTSCSKNQPSIKTNLGFKADRTISIEVSPTDSAKCDVDFPVAFLRAGNKNKVAWKSDDNDYTVHFVSYSGGPSPENPFDPSTDSVSVPAGNYSKLMKIKIPAGSGGYYKYEILDASNRTCKAYDDDHDTGVNVKP
ncbi:MAG TPA: hypothetical protein VMU28_04245 [Terriglobales bacterium]|nr:hypothetical protein [Terriglobales bacterium]